jgi:hypothetical protein
VSDRALLIPLLASPLQPLDMNNRVIPALLCAAAIAFACGPHPQGTAQSLTAAVRRPAGRATAAKAPVITSSLETRVADRVTFTFNVTNAGAKLVELSFPSGQSYDFTVVDATGHEVWRWSDDRMFTQSLTNRQLSARETATFAEAMPAGGLHGTYTVVARLESSTHPVEQRQDFTLP